MTLAGPIQSGNRAMARRERKHDAMWTRMFAVDDWIKRGRICAYCHEPIERTAITGDHVDPVSRGGFTRRENVKACCVACNATKANMSEAAFLKAIKSPKPGEGIYIWMAWSRRRIWLRTERACKRIMAVAR